MIQKKSGEKNKRAADPLAFCRGGVLSWRFLALLALACCAAFDAIQYLVPLDNGTPLLYVFFPASVIVFAFLAYDCRYVKYPEIRFLVFFILWMCASVVLNRSRAHIVDSYLWFASVCVTSFLCFSFPYAFSKKGAARVLTVLAITTLAAVTLLSAVGLTAVFVKDAETRAPALFSGFGIYGGRLWLDSNPNRSAPYCAAGVVLTVYLLVRLKKALPRILVSIGGAICFTALVLTDSRTAIIGACVAIGFETFLLSNVWLNRAAWMKKARAALRVAISALMMCLAIAACYLGTGLVRSAYDAYSAETDYAAAAGAPVEEQALTPLQQDADETPDLTARDITDMESMRIRLDIWAAVLKGLAGNPKILAIGTGPAVASDLMKPYFPEGSPVGIFHNSLLGALVSFGVVGLLFALIFLVLIAVAAVRFSFGGLTNADTLAVRLLPAMLLFTVSESMMEDFLFVNGGVNTVWIWFMFSAGFVLRFLKAEPIPETEPVE